LRIQNGKLADISTIYGLAYLKELHEGRDPRFTGC
jgi:hypothetical protein